MLLHNLIFLFLNFIFGIFASFISVFVGVKGGYEQNNLYIKEQEQLKHLDEKTNLKENELNIETFDKINLYSEL